MKSIDFNKRIILALDVNTVGEAKLWVTLVKNKIRFFKVGYQLFLEGGLDFIRWLKDQDVDVMIDIKLFDIPETVNAVLERIYSKTCFEFITIHSRLKILKNIPEEFKSKILGITVLDNIDRFESIDEKLRKEENNMLYECQLEKDMISELIVYKRILNIISTNCCGVIMSSMDLKSMNLKFKEDLLRKEKYENDLIKVIPVVKLEKPRNEDQFRVVSYGDAFKNGADYIVVGRPILQSDNPLKLIDKVQEYIKLNFFL